MSKDQILANYKYVINGLLERFADQSAEVRKSVVFSLVEFAKLKIKEIEFYFDKLSTSQKKLIEVYV